MIEPFVIVLPFIHPREKRVLKKYHYNVSLGVSVCLHISYILYMGRNVTATRKGGG